MISEGTDSFKGGLLAKQCRSGSTSAATAAAVTGGQFNPHRISRGDSAWEGNLGAAREYNLHPYKSCLTNTLKTALNVPVDTSVHTADNPTATAHAPQAKRISFALGRDNLTVGERSAWSSSELVSTHLFAGQDVQPSMDRPMGAGQTSIDRPMGAGQTSNGPSIPSIPAIADTGCDHVLIRNENASILRDLVPFQHFHVKTANGAIMSSTGRGTLRIPTSTGHIDFPSYTFPNSILTKNLFGLADLTMNGCTIELTNTGISIFDKTKTLIWFTPKEPSSRVWNLDLATFQQVENTNSIAAHSIKHTTDAERVAYAHACFGFPPISTFLKAVRNGWLYNFEPSLTTQMITTNQPVSKYTALGFLDQTPTRIKPTSSHDLDNLESQLSADDCDEIEEITTDEFAHVQIINSSDFLSSSDNTGSLPLTTTNGFNYILVSVMEHYTHLILMKSRTQGAYTAAFTALYSFYKSKGKRPKYQCLDNEVSTSVNELFADPDIDVEVQFVPPSQHRANIAERAIRHAKNTIIAMVAAVDENLDPRVRFERVLPQAEIVINHLKACTRIPSITAWEGMHNSKYDFQAHPICIYGMRAIVYESPQDRGTWANHGVDGFYIGPEIRHYRCWEFYIPSTNRTRTSDTVQWLPQAFQLPGSSPIHRFEAAYDDLREAIISLKDSDAITAFEQRPASSETSSAMHKLRLLDSMMNPEQVQRVSPTTTYTNPQPATVPPTVTTTTIPQRVQTPADNDDRYPDDVQWEVVHYNKLPQNGQKFFSKVGDTYTDKTDIPPVVWKVVAVAKNTIRTHRVGTAIQWYYRVYDTAIYSSPPHSADDYEHISCNEVYKSPNVKWSGLTHAKPPTRTRTFAPNPIQLRGSTSKSRKTLPQANMLTTTDEDIEYLNSILEFRQALHPLTPSPAPSPFLDAHAMFIESAYDADLPPLNLTPDGRKLTYSNALKGPTMEAWQKSNAAEFVKLIKTTKTMHPIHFADIPVDRRGDIGYYNPQVKEKYKDGAIDRRTRGTIGGNVIEYPGPTSSRTASLETVKILINSAVSTNEDLATCDIKDFYLGTPMPRPEYLRVTRKQIPDETMIQFDLDQYVTKDVVYFQVNKGMYGLKQAGLLANDRIVEHLAKYDYIQSKYVPCLFVSKDKSTAFCLIVDDLLIKANNSNRERLYACLRVLYEITTDDTGSKYINIEMRRDRSAGTIACAMKGYMDKVITRFDNWAGTRSAKSPGIYQPPSYGIKQQFTAPEDHSKPLSPADINTLQQLIGSVLYYTRAIDPTYMHEVNKLGSEQASATESILPQAQRLLEYARAYPDSELVFRKSKMELIVQTDASYNSRKQARSVAGFLMYFGDAKNALQPTDKPTLENGAIMSGSVVMDVIVASAGEAEYGAGFIAAQHAVNVRIIAEELGHPQPPTPILCDNSFARNLAMDSCKQRRSKAIDMRFHWLRDRIRQNQFVMVPVAGKDILADIFTKTLSVKDFQRLIPRLIQPPPQPVGDGFLRPYVYKPKPRKVQPVQL